MTILQVNSYSIDQKSGEICAGQADLQPISFKSDRLLGSKQSRSHLSFNFIISECVQYDIAIEKDRHVSLVHRHTTRRGWG